MIQNCDSYINIASSQTYRSYLPNSLFRGGYFTAHASIVLTTDEALTAYNSAMTYTHLKVKTVIIHD
jgi:hypothetical protein